MTQTDQNATDSYVSIKGTNTYIIQPAWDTEWIIAGTGAQYGYFTGENVS